MARDIRFQAFTEDDREHAHGLIRSGKFDELRAWVETRTFPTLFCDLDRLIETLERWVAHEKADKALKLWDVLEYRPIKTLVQASVVLCCVLVLVAVFWLFVYRLIWGW